MPPKKDSLEKVNNKGRQAMSGTTSQARRQAREVLQWTSLAMADPPATSSASLQEKEEALKKALASVEKQKAEALEKEHEEEEALKKVEHALETHSARGKNGPRSRSLSRARLTPREEVAKKEALRERLNVHLERLKEASDPSKKGSLQRSLEKGKEPEPGIQLLEKGGREAMCGAGLAQYP